MFPPNNSIAASSHSLHRSAIELLLAGLQRAPELRIAQTSLSNGTTVIDFGVGTVGGLAAGQLLAEICLGGRAEVSVLPADPRWEMDCDSATEPEGGRSTACGWPTVQVVTDAPVEACILSQYAGWPVSVGSFFAMGSGPMRLRRKKEPVLVELVGDGATADSSGTIGVLECDCIPAAEVAEEIARECSIEPSQLYLCVAPTRSIAGTLQVVARSIETSLHKLHELGFPISEVVSGVGTAPLPGPAIDFVEGIGRTNDSILYGGHVRLWVTCEDQAIERVGAGVPSSNSTDYGKPFAETFKSYGCDFYKVDPGLFSPAMLTIHSLRTGKTWSWGELRPDILKRSFA